MQDLFSNIKSLCEQNNISLSALSTNLGFSGSLIRKWDKTVPSIEKIKLVAEYFNVSIDYLIGNTDIPEPIDEILSDPDIITIQRLRSNLSLQNKEKMMKLLKIQFEEDFPDDN